MIVKGILGIWYLFCLVIAIRRLVFSLRHKERR